VHNNFGEGVVVLFLCVVDDVSSFEGSSSSSVLVGAGWGFAVSFGMFVSCGLLVVVVVVGFVSVVSAGDDLLSSSTTSFGGFSMEAVLACGFVSSVDDSAFIFTAVDVGVEESKSEFFGGCFKLSVVSDVVGGGGFFVVTSIVSIGFVIVVVVGGGGEVAWGLLTAGDGVPGVLPAAGASTLLPTSLPPMLPSDPAPKSSEESRRRLACCSAVTLEAISCSL
jgi:hypothetical protein